MIRTSTFFKFKMCVIELICYKFTILEINIITLNSLYKYVTFQKGCFCCIFITIVEKGIPFNQTVFLF